ncbi:MAG: SH3 domain-containing protein [Pseudomonadota bacterium]
MKYLKNVICAVVITTLLGFASVSHADQDLISVFPLDNYHQSIAAWINPDDTEYDKPLLNAEMQNARFEIFMDHYVGASSPWNADYINKLLQPSSEDLKALEQEILNTFNNAGKAADQIGYGENFHPYPPEWIEEIANNIPQLAGLTYQSNNRGIVIENLHARALPTDDVYFYHYKIAGEGYPFDNLQMSAVWVGTPVYIVAESRDQAWMLVVTPEFIGWVKSSGIARADEAFINTWTKAAKIKLAAITHTQTSVTDREGKFLFSAYVGTVFPVTAASADQDAKDVSVPIADENHHAKIKSVVVRAGNAVAMPLAATPRNFSMVMETLIGRPYGWGGMYFYNDCSAELKNLLAPFGIWLPRNSSRQAAEGNMVDLSAESVEKRISYLMANGHRFLTLIHINGHVMLYVGNFPNPNQGPGLMAMTYQNTWGLQPNPSTRRAVIGKAVLFPLLAQYPEDTSLVSQAGKKNFEISNLDELPNANLLMQQRAVSLRALMFP